MSIQILTFCVNSDAVVSDLLKMRPLRSIVVCFFVRIQMTTKCTFKQCGIFFPKRYGVVVKDTNGCHLPEGHRSDEHEFISTCEKRVQWYMDFECDCECCQSEDSDDWCIGYRIIENATNSI